MEQEVNMINKYYLRVPLIGAWQNEIVPLILLLVYQNICIINNMILGKQNQN